MIAILCVWMVIFLLPRGLELEVCPERPEERREQLQYYEQNSKEHFHGNPFLWKQRRCPARIG